MSEAPPAYCVLLSRPESRPSPADVAQALAAAVGGLMQDYLLKARRCFGVVETGISQDQAAVLAEQLKKRGVETLVVPASLLEDPPVAAACSALKFSAEGLSARLAGGAWTPAAPWESLAALGAAVFKQSERRVIRTEQGPDMKQRAIAIGIGLATGLPIGFGGKKSVEKVVETRDLVHYLDVMLAGPTARLRVDAQGFDFSCLGARMGLGAGGNFRRLVAELSERAPKALRGRGARALLAGEPLAQLGYESLADLDAECRWLWTLRALGGNAS